MARRATMSMGLAAIGAAFSLVGCGRHAALPGDVTGNGPDAASADMRSDQVDDGTPDAGETDVASGVGGATGVGGAAGESGAGGTSGAGGSGAGCGTLMPEMFIVLDRSASMADTPDGNIAGPTDPTKWSLVVPALNQLLATKGDSFTWGLKTFPEDGPACGSTTVTSRIDVPVASGNVPGITAAIMAATPAGNGTPTAAAIQVATSYLMGRSSPSRRYLLLVTDGEPGCAGNPPTISNVIQAQADAVNAVTAAAQAGIHTFVVGVATNKASDSMNLSALAIAGLEPRNDLRPGATRYYAAQTQDELFSALNAITSGIGPTSTCPGADGGTDASGDDGTTPGSLLFSDDFEDSMWQNRWLVTVPTDGSSWSVADDGGNHVLTQSAVLTSSVGSHVAGGNVGWTDQMVEARVKLVTTPARVHLAARFADNIDYYFLELSDTGALKIRKRAVGGTTDIVAVAGGVPLAVGDWNTLGLKVEGDTLSAYFNGTLVANASDPGAPIPAGGVGLGTIYNGAEFDDVRVTLP
jgi:hypothetical protein